MEDIYFFFLIFLSIINIGLKGNNNFYNDYMDLKYTNPLKGIFVWLIILRHYYTYIKNKNYLYIKILQYLGQKIVSLFLFYSGYGIYESLTKKGKNYAKTLPKKAFILFIKFQISIFIFFLSNLILGIKLKISRYFLSMIFISAVGNSNWFAFTIITFYLYSYFSFVFIKKETLFLGLLFLNVIIIIHIYLVYNYFYPKLFYPIDNSLCFILGFYYSLIRQYIDKLLMKDDSYYFTIISSIIVIYFYFYINKFKGLLYILMINCFFCFIVIFISMKIRFNNEFLIFLNSHSFSIYLLQRVIMNFIRHKKYFENHEFIRLSFEFTAIISLSCLFDKLFKIEKLFANKNKNHEKIYFLKHEEINLT